jgi:ferredoxin-NADP reductase
MPDAAYLVSGIRYLASFSYLSQNLPFKAVQPWQNGKVIRILNETASTKRFWIQLPELERFDFKPGQFVTLDLPIHEKVGKRIRSYSIASWPDGTNVFELVIVYMDGGAGTHYLFNEIGEGSSLQIRGPQGVFVLPEVIEKDLFFICTGTGIAPFRSMSHYILNNNIPHREIFLIFGCRTTADWLYGPELTALAEKMPSFYYLPTFSREKFPDGGALHSGYVHALYEKICNDKKSASGQALPASFYLCGWKNMIDEAKKRIQDLGYDKKSIHQELYG